MLIRLCNHHIDNPAQIDKLICIKGLPDEWFFRESRFGGKELIRPWEPDVEVNIPKEIRHLCDPVEITQAFPPIEKGGSYTVDKKTILGLRFDFMTEAGELVWEKIERYLERSVPRDVVIQKPVLVAANHKTGFDPHESKRTTRGSLQLRPSEVPMIDLRASVSTLVTAGSAVNTVIQQVLVPAMQKPVEEKKAATDFTCETCGKTFDKKRALSMHAMRGHAKEKVGV